MFYGYYTNTSSRCQTDGSAPHNPLPCVQYSIPAAYFFTIAIAFFTICIHLVYRLVSTFILFYSAS